MPGGVIELAEKELNRPTTRAHPVVVVTDGATTFTLDAFAWFPLASIGVTVETPR